MDESGTLLCGQSWMFLRSLEGYNNTCVTLSVQFKEAARNVNQLKPYRALNRVSEYFN